MENLKKLKQMYDQPKSAEVTCTIQFKMQDYELLKKFAVEYNISLSKALRILSMSELKEHNETTAKPKRLGDFMTFKKPKGFMIFKKPTSK
jgi:hypothetical protein